MTGHLQSGFSLRALVSDKSGDGSAIWVRILCPGQWLLENYGHYRTNTNNDTVYLLMFMISTPGNKTQCRGQTFTITLNFRIFAAAFYLFLTCP
jgi:hypothetical protein